MRSNSCDTHTRAFGFHKMISIHIHRQRLRRTVVSHVVATIRRVHCGHHFWRAFRSTAVDRIGLGRRLAALGQVSPANGFAPNGRASAPSSSFQFRSKI